MSKRIEEKVEEYYKAKFDRLHITHYGKNKEQISKINPNIYQALSKAPSKSGGTGNNYPDIMLMLNSNKLNRHIPVIIEAKGTRNKLEKLDNNEIIQVTKYQSDSKPAAKNPHKKGDPNYTTIKNFAVNGAYHYAKIIVDSDMCSYDEAIFIGINGTKLDKDNILIDPEQKAYYLSKKNKMQPKHISDLDKSFELLKDNNIEKFVNILDKLTLSDEELEALTKKTEDKLETAIKQIHQEIYDNKELKTALTTNEKLYLFSGLIMAGLPTPNVKTLTPESFLGNMTKKSNDGQVALQQINNFLDSREASEDKIKMIINLLLPVFTKPILWENRNGESMIKHIFSEIYQYVLPLLKSDLRLDFTGKILNSLSDWVSLDNDLRNDVILTPRYVTNFMVKLAHTDMDSYVWDTAMGSGGFLVSAMDEMIKDAQRRIQDQDTLNKKIDQIKRQQLLGIEILGNIYILAVLNMILMGDGSSNIRNGNSHELYQKLSNEFPANVFLLNPPYSSEGKGFNFVAEAFSKMKNGYGVILIQENAGSGKGLPYTKNILDENTLIASIHMPSDLFNGKATVQTAIYVFKIGEPHNEQNIVKFIDFSEDGYTRQNRKKSSQSVNLKDSDHAKERYQEVIDIVLGRVTKTKYYTEKNKKLIIDSITKNGDDWTFNQHIKVNTKPTEEDFMKTVGDYLSFQVNQLTRESNNNEISGKISYKLGSVKWGKRKLEKLFIGSNGDIDIQQKHINNKGINVITSGLTNFGIMGKSDVPAKIFNQNSLTVDMFGNVFYRNFDYKLVTHSRVFSLKPLFDMTPNIGLFISSALSFLKDVFRYNNMCSWNKIKDLEISLPITENNKIDFRYIEQYVQQIKEQYVQQIKAYLKTLEYK